MKEPDPYALNGFGQGWVPDPSLELQRIVERGNASCLESGRVHFILQFKHLPNGPRRAALAEVGIAVGTYLGGNAYAAGMSIANLPSLRALEDVRGALPIEPSMKLAPALRRAAIPTSDLNPDGTAQLGVTFHQDVWEAAAGEVIARLGGTVLFHTDFMHHATVDLHPGAVTRLAEEDQVLLIALIPYVAPENRKPTGLRRRARGRAPR